ncbi:enoyl-CoA hydratase/isomerase family protein [Achromobacter aegrifaciens]|uniref:enoyl-CoA hydratase/isomerase family protein n=1 Tax=Achromobacter aegrifaciens TaxID=1287736 RepID=UPI000F74A9E2|nr:enoyl-CoA hydratase/isomerase family protein [Achromobacter aegrifaciens]RSE99988.1 enoyl-CoA hydratase/isomerase family protein [Achromobacter aegrifaciens]
MTLKITRHGATAVLAMDRPDQRNALSLEMREAFARALPELREDDGIKAVILTGSGGHFCAGGDIKSIAQAHAQGLDAFEGRARIRKIHQWYDTLVDLEKPVISAVEGVAFGAGLSLALCADYAIARRGATFCAVFARIGYVPDMLGMYLLPRAVGRARAKELVFTARVCDAEEALDLGLVQALCDGDPLEQALAMAERFHSAPTQALGLAKTIMNRTFESSREDIYAQEAMAQAICRDSAFHREAARRFVEKLPPAYKWD